MSELSIPNSIIQKAEDSAANKMRVPESARTSNRNAEVRFWEEAGTITAASQKEFPSDGGTTTKVLFYETTCSAEGSGLNIGFVIKSGLRFCASAMESGSPENLAKMSFLSTNRLVALLRAVGIPPDADGYSQETIARCFPPEDQFPGDPSELLGKTIRFEVKQGPTEGKDGKRRWFPEIITIFEVV